MMGKKIVENARIGLRPRTRRWPVTLHVLPGIEDQPASKRRSSVPPVGLSGAVGHASDVLREHRRRDSL